MLTILNILFDICFLKRGPQHLPSSTVLAVLVTIIYVGASVVLDQLTDNDDLSLARALVYTILSYLLVRLFLQLRGLRERLLQTWTAIAGCGVLISVAVTPLAWTLGLAQDRNTPADPLATMAFLFLFFWSFVVDAHILRHALTVTFSAGFLYATAIFATLSVVRYLLFAPTP